MRCALATVLMLTLMALLPLGTATHVPSHSYYVSGRLVHPDGSPACGVTVEAGPDTDGSFLRGVTDHNGHYRIELHFHNVPNEGLVEVGETFEVRVLGTDLVATRTTAVSAAQDAWGESRADFVVPQDVGGACVDPVTTTALYLGVPLAAAAGLSVAYVKVLRPWWARRSIAPTMTSLPGIGKAREKELRAMGIASLEDLAAAQPAQVARETSIGKKEARRLIRRARETLQNEEV